MDPSVRRSWACRGCTSRADRRKLDELREYRSARDGALVEERLAELREVATGDGNIMPATIEAIRARATGGEIVEVLRSVFGSYVEHAVF